MGNDSPPGPVFLSALAWLFLAMAYTSPAINPMVTAETEEKFTGSPKKIMPDAATGSLFNAPTMLRNCLGQ